MPARIDKPEFLELHNADDLAALLVDVLEDRLARRTGDVPRSVLREDARILRAAEQVNAFGTGTVDLTPRERVGELTHIRPAANDG